MEVGETKNDEGRTVYLDDELKGVIDQQWQLRKKTATILSFVYLNKDYTDQIKRFDKAWKKACKEAKINIRIFHDFRLTAVRNMVRSGVPERAAMMISGHKTRSVFDRYNIVSDEDLKLAAQKQANCLASQMGTISGSVHEFGKNSSNDDTR